MTGEETGHPVVLALTGASGAAYGLRLLDVLARRQVPVWLIPSDHGMRLLRDECAIQSLDDLKAATGGDWSSVTVFPDSDRGEFRFRSALSPRAGKVGYFQTDLSASYLCPLNSLASASTAPLSSF